MGSMPVVGLPAGAPERPPEVRAYPAVHDMPPPRTTATLDGPAQQQMERELVEARERQKTAVGPTESAPARKPPARPAAAPTSRTAPTSSSQMVY
jgi:hypothetical protein